MPKKVEIPFLPEFKESMLSGKKKATTRTKRYGDPGDWFEQFGRIFVLQAVYPIYLDIVVRYKYLEEGFESSHAFVECWDRLHPRVHYAQNPGRTVYHHIFA